MSLTIDGMNALYDTNTTMSSGSTNKLEDTLNSDL